jgi:hypothetical protein
VENTLGPCHIIMVILLGFENNYTLDSRSFVVKFHHLAIEKRDYEFSKRVFFVQKAQGHHISRKKK